MNNFIQKILLSIILIIALGALPGVFGGVNAQDLKIGGASATGTQMGIVQGPLSLKDCLARALEGNPLLAEARLGVRAGEKAVDSAWGRHFPRLSLDGNYTQRQDPWPFIPAQSNTIAPHFSDSFATLAVVMTLPIYQGGQVATGVDLARVRKTFQEENLAMTRNEVITNTINTYNKILQIQKLREAAQSSVAALETQRQNTQLLFDLGRFAKVDLLKVEVQLANERQRLLSIDEGLANLAGTLFYLMGEPAAGPVVVPTLSDPLTLSQFVADFDLGLATAQKKRPEYRIAETIMIEAGLNRSLAKGKFLPTIGAFAGYMDQYGFNPWYKESNWFGGLNLSLPLFEKSLYDELAKERILEDKAEKHFASVGNQLGLDLQTSISSVKESRSRVLTSGNAVDQAEESFRIEQKKYASGAGVVVDMLFAQSAYVTAVANHTQALFDYNAAIVAYRKVTGTLEDYLQ
jgi:outer membrane protein